MFELGWQFKGTYQVPDSLGCQPKYNNTCERLRCHPKDLEVSPRKQRYVSGERIIRSVAFGHLEDKKIFRKFDVTCNVMQRDDTSGSEFYK